MLHDEPRVHHTSCLGAWFITSTNPQEVSAAVLSTSIRTNMNAYMLQSASNFSYYSALLARRPGGRARA